MEEITPFENIIRMKQVFAVGGTFDQPSDFTRKLNENLKVLRQSDNNLKVKDIQFSVYSDRRFSNSPPIYLAFIVAEVDVDIAEHEPISKKKKKDKKKKKR